VAPAVLARFGPPAQTALLDAGEEHRQADACSDEHQRRELRVVGEHDFRLALAVVVGIGRTP
jgi:hypothetical protein